MQLRLKEIRQKRGFTQREVAEHIGCTVSAYSKYETGDREPSISVLSSLADFHGVSVDYLIGREITDAGALTEYEKDVLVALCDSSDFTRRMTLYMIKMLDEIYRSK